MNYRLIIATAACVAASSMSSAADVGVSISVGQPGFYGRMDLGDFPAPALLYPQPVIVQPVPTGVVVGPPLYLRVPPGHAKHWSKHCAEYGACGQRVYFVRDDWYNNVYVPRYREQHEYHDDDGDRGEHGSDHGKGHGKKGHKHD